MAKWKENHEESNPALHGLYVKTAIDHLLTIDRAIKTFHDKSNLNMNGATRALYRERNKLVQENKAYADAQELLERLAENKLINLCGDVFIGYREMEE
jgi:hypothetical protein